jgi:tRNA(adenine34) deaminase
MYWQTLTPPWQACMEEAWEAYCAGSLPIGACLISKLEMGNTNPDIHNPQSSVLSPQSSLLARGRNRIFEDQAVAPFLNGHRLAHAEVNAILALVKQGADPRACVLYTTTEPCPFCIGAIRMTGVPEVRYASRDPAAGSVSLLAASPFMSRRGTRIVGPEDPVLEIIVMAMHADVTLRQAEQPPSHSDRAYNDINWLLETWEAVVPLGVALGRLIHQSGALRVMCSGAAPASRAVDFLAELATELHHNSQAGALIASRSQSGKLGS